MIKDKLTNNNNENNLLENLENTKISGKNNNSSGVNIINTG